METEAYIAIDKATGKVTTSIIGAGPLADTSLAEAIEEGHVIRQVSADEARLLFGKRVPACYIPT